MKSNELNARRRFALAAASAGLSLLALTAGCGKSGGPPPEFSVEGAVTKPEVMVVEDTLPAVGTIEADERVVLQPEVSGLVESIQFTEGQRVKKGDVLFRLRSRKEEAQLAQARADKNLAKANLERAQTLAGTKAISQQELDQMASALEARSATYELENRRLEERVILAPFDGVVGTREVSVGQYVNAGTPLVTLVEDARVKVLFRIPERQLAQLKVGQNGRVRVSAYGDRGFEGQVDMVSPEVDVATRTVPGRLIVSNPEGLLRPGMFARVELVIGRRADALVVPESALIPSLDEFGVFAVEADRARLHPVKVGVRLPGKVELLTGLTRETTVVISGTQKLVDGTKVKAAPDKSGTIAMAQP
ncbi:MAG: efflux RND transporter periplasmic adaptor subunit [Verrucomicrobiales bacterium]|nr:efflux RND transporter periplasmic adaptor subunit [Verrucomicrobiales bacterium]